MKLMKADIRLDTFEIVRQALKKEGYTSRMVWVKKVFGVVLVGAALFFLVLAWFPKYVLYTLPPTLILGGIYLGFLESSGENMKILLRVKHVVGIGGLLVIMNPAKPTVDWESYDAAKLKAAASAETPVVLGFTADWCMPCLELDRITFTDPDVIAALQPYRTIKVDLTDYESPEAEALRKQFGVAGVPTIIFLDKESDEVKESRITGFVNAEEFLNKLPSNKVK